MFCDVISNDIHNSEVLGFATQSSFHEMHFRGGPRQGPRFTIRMVIGIFCSDTETGAVTPPGVMQKK